MEDGLLSLKWNNHKSTFFHILSSLRKKETYTDATLACDGRFFPVHKLVMSTCSDYFCEVFENTNCKSPVVILKDIKPGDLESLLDYMYLGEVDVKQNELAGLIKAAECLRIKGLAVPDEDPALSPKKTHIPESRQSPSAKRARRESVPDASSNTALCSNQNHHSLSPSRSHSSTVSNTVPSQSVNSDTLSQVPSLSVPPVYTDKRHSSLSVNDSQKHTDQSDIVPIEMIKVEVDDENSNNSQLHRSKDRPIGQSGGKEDSRGEGSGNNNNIEESHRDRESISNNFSDYSAGNQSTDIEKEEHDQIDPFNESDQVAGPSGVQGGSQLVNWGEEEGSFPHNLFGNDDSSHQQVWIPKHLDEQCSVIIDRNDVTMSMFGTSKDFACFKCSHVFENASSFDFHKRSNPKCSAFYCEFCEYKAWRRSDVIKHVRIHTGEKPFSCPYCHHRATQRGSIEKHIQTLHFEKCLPCSICSYISTSKANLIAHKQKDHYG